MKCLDDSLYHSVMSMWNNWSFYWLSLNLFHYEIYEVACICVCYELVITVCNEVFFLLLEKINNISGKAWKIKLYYVDLYFLIGYIIIYQNNSLYLYEDLTKYFTGAIFTKVSPPT